MLFFKKTVRVIIAKLSNLKLAIFLLLLIAATSVSGTIIEQNQPLAFYQTNYPIQAENLIDFNWKIILFFGLNQVYKNIWFLTLLLVFGSCLIACTFTTQLPTLKRLRKWALNKKIAKSNSKELVLIINNQFNKNRISKFNKEKNYYTIYQKGELYSSKGLVGRIAPILVHISIILILLGSAISAVDSFFVQEMVPKKETYHLQNIIDSGNISKIPQDLTVRVNNFWITYNALLTTNQFYSDISVLDNSGNEVKRDQIFVNKPLTFNGLTIYQTDWNIVGVQLNVEKERKNFNIQLPTTKLQDEDKIAHWCTKTTTEITKESVTICADNLISKLTIYDQKGKQLEQVQLNEPLKNAAGEKINIEKLITATGLQIKKDSGVLLIYSGFAFLILSTYLSYISYVQLWISKEESEYKVVGSSNRATYTFNKEMILNFKNTEQSI